MGNNCRNVNKWKQLTYGHVIGDYSFPFKNFSYCYAVCVINKISKIIEGNCKDSVMDSISIME